jgi:tetratricopeptide (TPR) repeat protein
MGVPLAEELVSWPVDEWLAQAAHLMHDPIVGLLRGSRTGTMSMLGGGSPSSDLVSLGQELYNALFQGTIRDSWMIAQGVAQSQKQILRLRLGLKGDRLPRLPWEVLHDGARPLATGTDVVFSRYQSVFAAFPCPVVRPAATEADRPLRILMVLAAPTDQEVLQLHQEAAHLQAELQRDSHAGQPPTLEVTILDQPGREQLTQALERGHYDILHYAGHSNLSGSGGDLYLVSNKTGLTEVLSGDDLAGLLVNNGVHMAVFNSCRGVYTATAAEGGGNAGSLAEALLKRGVPAVLAMAERIPDEVALSLSRLFYRNLKQHSPIDLSLSRARQGLLSAYGSDQLYWALPILYLHPDFDGYLQPQPSLDQAGLREDELLDFTDAAAVLQGLETPEPDDRSAVLDLFQQLSQSSPSSSASPASSARTAAVESRGQMTPSQAATLTTAPPAATARTAEDFMRLGQTLYAHGDLTGAISAYGEALQLDPEHAETYHHLGLAFQKYGSLPEALTSFKMAVRLDPNLTSAQRSLEQLLQSSPATLDSTSALSPPQQTVAQAASFGRTQPQPTAPQRRQFPRLNTLLTIGATALVLGSLAWLITRPGVRPAPTPVPGVVPAQTSPTAEQALVATATQSFQQGDLRQGQDAVSQLLDQGKLVEAEVSLKAVPTEQLEVPAISFLRGRLSWEFAQRNPDGIYHVDDAWRYWQVAVKAQPTNTFYRNALGFAYYADDLWPKAQEQWSAAATQMAGQTSVPPSSDRELLTAYAGQGLVLAQLATQQPARRTALMKDAIALRDRVLQANPIDFQADRLAQDWRWSEQAIADWRKLLQAKVN